VYDPKPAYRGARLLTTELAGYRFVQRVNAGGADDYVLEFARGGKRKYAAWTRAAAPRRDTLPGGREIVLTGTPVYQ